jgi:signal transduction histidine kinase
MLAKLRRRFILITMSLIGVVLLAVLVVSVVSSFQAQFLSIQNSTMQAVNQGGDLRPWLGGGGRSGISEPDDQGGGSGSNNIGGGNGSVVPLQPVYLVVIDDHTGWLIEQFNSTAMDEELLETALGRVASSSSDSGFLTDLGLYYQRQYHNENLIPITRIAFADTTQLFSTTLQQVGVAVLIFVIAMTLFFFISLFLSKIALRPVEQAWEQQRRFVADASHELKTPLTVILANNNIMQAHPEKPTGEQQQWLQSTQEEAQRMDALVRDLLLLAIVEEQQEQLGQIGKIIDKTYKTDNTDQTGNTRVTSRESDYQLDLSALVERGLLQFDAVFFERGIKVESDIQADIKIVGNAEQLGRLIAILLDNASKYSDDDGTVSVSVSRAKNGQALLKVSNTGEAIDPSKINHIFERFYRGDTSHSNTIEGSGLGLSLAKAIVEANSGKISVSSNASGTTFLVQLPLLSLS